VYLKIRRIAEICGILIFSPIVLTVIAAAAIAVRIDSPGRIFFRQLRPGLHGKPFSIIKFRTMHNRNAGNFRLTSVQDDRVTRVGKFLRKYKIDELPQLWNVLKGEMSIVGPRPEPLEISRELEHEIPGYSLRRNVPPGMTGLSQVHQGYAETVADSVIKLRYDLEYIENISAATDLKILLKTIKTVVNGENSR
jgi:lipopolysaccharide/colanic/teichoic acid biosynthesis glycosyltransferase